jgi:hypothetical protein
LTGGGGNGGGGAGGGAAAAAAAAVRSRTWYVRSSASARASLWRRLRARQQWST